MQVDSLRREQIVCVMYSCENWKKKCMTCLDHDEIHDVIDGCLKRALNLPFSFSVFISLLYSST